MLNKDVPNIMLNKAISIDSNSTKKNKKTEGAPMIRSNSISKYHSLIEDSVIEVRPRQAAKKTNIVTKKRLSSRIPITCHNSVNATPGITAIKGSP